MFEQTWRWFGDKDPVSLMDIKQAGATGVVTALHHIPNGEMWPVTEIEKVKQEIEAVGLRWSVVESVPVHESVKTRSGNYSQLIENYKGSIANLGQCGINTICYNFMPVIDWTRTSLNYEQPDGSRALKFDIDVLAAFDIYILKRANAASDYSDKTQKAAAKCFAQMSESEIQSLTNNIIAGLPGAEEGYGLEKFKQALATYNEIDEATLKNNLLLFLHDIIPVAEANKVYMAIHPDDPPFSIFGLPRAVSTHDNLNSLFSEISTPYNGLTFCTGSFGSRRDNDLLKMITSYAERINFVHLRNVTRYKTNSFYESNHLEGDVDMYEVIKALLIEHSRSESLPKGNKTLPMRPDHGHQMLDDLSKNTNPGYSAIGRLRGLAELRGLELGIIKSMDK